MKPPQLLQLAESIAAKQSAQAEAAGAALSQDCVMLHCALLQAQGRHDAAVELLHGRAGAAFVMPAERRLMTAAIMVSFHRLIATDVQAALVPADASMRAQAQQVRQVACPAPGRCCFIYFS